MSCRDKISVPNGCSPVLLGRNWFDIYDKLGSGMADLILTDPPYGILEKEGWDRQIALDEMESSFDRVLKETGQVIMFCSLELLHKSLEQFSYFKLRSYHIWQKTTAMPISKLMPLPNQEFIIVLKKKGMRTTDLAWNPKDVIPPGDPYYKKSNIVESPTRRQIKSGVHRNDDGKRWVPVILPAPNKPNMKKLERSNHPSQKPEKLLRMLIRGYSNKNDLIVDPFSGSGSTLISAMKENRRSLGVELNTEFYAEASDRIVTAMSELNTLEIPFGETEMDKKVEKILDTQVSV